MVLWSVPPIFMQYLILKKKEWLRASKQRSGRDSPEQSGCWRGESENTSHHPAPNRPKGGSKGGHSLHGFLERETEKPIKSEEMSQTDRHVWNSVWTEIRACGERKFCAEGIDKGKSPP
ncbi:hypothetical protein AVEN_98360-1 [Araneus ventricosus]|uniref:Uncharacterized protein n=1 Tax=Araneus ventricosus TaxID=182803 RepID=A0A4Y2X028_ARAVE|nr:hypothetical protein AVEN_98360-1 [Araneus ventricosus]